MSGIEKAINCFASDRFKQLAEAIITELREHKASGIYGDDAENIDGSPLRTLWDEFRYEVHFGPTDQLEQAWDETLRPFLDAALASVPISEQQLLVLGTTEGPEFDFECEDPPPLDDAALVQELTGVLRDLAGTSEKILADEVSQPSGVTSADFAAWRRRLRLSVPQIGIAFGYPSRKVEEFESGNVSIPRVAALAMQALEHRAIANRSLLHTALTRSVTAQCEWNSEGQWDVTETFNTMTRAEVGDPGFDSFDPEDDSYVSEFLDGVIREHEEAGLLEEGELYRFEAIFKDGNSKLAGGYQYHRAPWRSSKKNQRALVAVPMTGAELR